MSKRIPVIKALLIGPPAAGKGTICALLSAKTGCPVISPGNIYRRMREEDTDLGRRVRTALMGGNLCPSELTNEVVLSEAERLSADGHECVIMDGYPRTIIQLEFLKDNFQVNNYIFCLTPFPRLLQAAINRRQCPDCDTLFSVSFPETQCGCAPPERWKMRFDDCEEDFTKRYGVYIQETSPVMHYIEEQPNAIGVDVLSQSLDYWDKQTTRWAESWAI